MSLKRRLLIRVGANGSECILALPVLYESSWICDAKDDSTVAFRCRLVDNDHLYH
jgi:hypothetical protein